MPIPTSCAHTTHLTKDAMTSALTPPLLNKLAMLTGGVLFALSAHAQDKAPGLIGKNNWLFYSFEFNRNPEEASKSIDLISKVAKALESNGTTLLVALAPIKARIYAEHLPDNKPLTPDLQRDYGRYLEQFKAAGIHTADINAAFLSSEKRTGEFPLYFQQDTHWSATGALLAAEAIRDAINAHPVTRDVLAATPETKWSIVWATRKIPKSGDLIQQLPPGSPPFEKELVTTFDVLRSDGSQPLLGDAATSGVALIGSSYTHEWTHFPKSIEFTLQRSVPSLSLAANIGQWYGLDTYLRSDAFQQARPKLLIWEMPERDLKATPSMPYREARYVLDNQEWLARVSSLVQQTCVPATNRLTFTPGKLVTSKNGSEASAASTTAQDKVELDLAQVSSKQEYLSAKLMSNGSKNIHVTLTGPKATTRQFTIEAAGDDQVHTFKIPLFSKTKGFNKIKLVPGDTNGFTLKDIELCQQPAGVVN